MKITIFFAVVALAMMIGGITTVDADKERLYCGPADSEGGRLCVGGTNQESKEIFDDNVKNECEETNEQISGEETKCTKQ